MHLPYYRTMAIPQPRHTSQGIEITYIYSACVVIRTPTTSILCDPWLTDGAYDGSWFHFPEIHNPIETIGDVDFVYISHIHPDHYDPVFLRSYFACYGQKKILIADRKFNYLKSKILADGFEVLVPTSSLEIGTSRITVIAQDPQNVNVIDSVLLVEDTDTDRTHRILNVNDVIFSDDTSDQEFIDSLRDLAPELDILLCGYTGAGPYPQTYFDLADPELSLAASEKKESFFQRYRSTSCRLNAKVNLPFAGKYVLGGHLSDLNPFRGVSDATEILRFDKKAIVLDDAGGCISTVDLVPSRIRTQEYPAAELATRIRNISEMPMSYEEISKIFISSTPMEELLAKAYQRAITRSQCDIDYFFIFELSNNRSFIINANKNSRDGCTILTSGVTKLEPRSEISIDSRYLVGLLTRNYHWNNAEIGSQYAVRRIPNLYNRDAQRFLNFLAI